MSAILSKAADSAELPLLVNAQVVARLLGISDQSVVRNDKLGRMPGSIMVGGRRLWDLQEIQEWVKNRCPDRNEWQKRTRTYRSQAYPPAGRAVPA